MLPAWSITLVGMVRIFIGLGVVALGLLIYCMVECIQTPRHRVRVLPKAAWIFIILLLPLLGPGLWMAFGRAKGRSAPDQRKGPRAPDDDPEFLRRVELQRRQQQRREEEARKKTEDERKRRDGEKRPGEKNTDAATGGTEPRAAADDDDPDAGPEAGPSPQRS